MISIQVTDMAGDGGVQRISPFFPERFRIRVVTDVAEQEYEVTTVAPQGVHEDDSTGELLCLRAKLL
jgi:hypothetical protein